jgi:hypothetical protein
MWLLPTETIGINEKFCIERHRPFGSAVAEQRASP